MTPCHACGTLTARPLCYFCQRTVELIKARRCVSCKGPVYDQDNRRVQGKCAECLGRNHPVSAATRLLLEQAKRARYALKAVA